MPRWITRQRKSMCVTPLGFYLRVIVNEKILNLEKTTSSVLSVLLLIYALIYSSCLLQFSGLRGFESLALAQINPYMFATWPGNFRMDNLLSQLLNPNIHCGNF